MDTEIYKIKLREKGFTRIYEWVDGPNVEYPEHTHKGKVSFCVTAGDIVMNIEGKSISLGAGDEIDVPVGVLHTAKTGPSGCSFIVGEEIEGDS